MENPLNKYLREHSSIPCGTLEWIEKQTNIRTSYPHMLSGSVQGQFLKMLVEITGASRVLEIGAFTGYSGCCLALGLPEGGRLDTLESNDELEDLMREGWERAGVSSKITLHLGNAIDTLKNLTGPYDLAFIDANKREYRDYYELVLPLMRQGGLIVADDVLWDGKVYENSISGDAKTQELRNFNNFAVSDTRVEVVMLPLRDGISLIRKK